MQDIILELTASHERAGFFKTYYVKPYEGREGQEYEVAIMDDGCSFHESVETYETKAEAFQCVWALVTLDLERQNKRVITRHHSAPPLPPSYDICSFRFLHIDDKGEYWIRSGGSRIGLHGEGEYSDKLNGSDFFALEKMEGIQ